MKRYLLLLFLAFPCLAWEPPLGIPRPTFGIDEIAGAFTHYIDNTKPCSNAGQGTIAQPRCAIPTTLSAGSVVEIHGGPYNYGSTSPTVTANGTLAQPVFFRGVGSPIISTTGTFSFQGSYLIVETIDFTAPVRFVGNTSHHLALRNSHIHHRTKGYLVNNSATDVVIYNNEVDHNGVIPSTADNHGVGTGQGSNHVWIVDNHIHHNSGDSIQFCHTCIGTGQGPANVYIGRNTLHEDEENAVDLKEFIGPVVISQNTMHGYKASADSNGDIVRINDEGAQGEVWLLNNHIHDGVYGINPARSKALVRVIGNQIHDIGSSAIGSNADLAVNNTIFGVGTGISSGAEAVNNAVAATGTAISGNTCSFNHIASGSATCGNTQSGSLELILNPDGSATGIEGTSASVDHGVEHPIYADFQSRFGLDIRRDFMGTVRPQGNWDIGAFEYTGVSAEPAPAPTPATCTCP